MNIFDGLLIAKKIVDANNPDEGVLEARDAKARFITSIASKINRWSC